MWIVLLTDGQELRRCYGPFDNEGLAKRYAEFLSAEVDPAVALPLASPVGEVLDWREAVRRA